MGKGTFRDLPLVHKKSSDLKSLRLLSWEGGRGRLVKERQDVRACQGWIDRPVFSKDAFPVLEALLDSVELLLDDLCIVLGTTVIRLQLLCVLDKLLLGVHDLADMIMEPVTDVVANPLVCLVVPPGMLVGLALHLDLVEGGRAPGGRVIAAWKVGAGRMVVGARVWRAVCSRDDWLTRETKEGMTMLCREGAMMSWRELVSTQRVLNPGGKGHRINLPMRRKR